MKINQRERENLAFCGGLGENFIVRVIIVCVVSLCVTAFFLSQD